MVNHYWCEKNMCARLQCGLFRAAEPS